MPLLPTAPPLSIHKCFYDRYLLSRFGSTSQQRAPQVEQAQEAEKRGPARGEDVRDDALDDEVPRRAFKIVLYPAYFYISLRVIDDPSCILRFLQMV